jgi:hypothetical protein
MGTLAKRLGQVAAKSLETESANIIKTAAANKVTWIFTDSDTYQLSCCELCPDSRRCLSGAWLALALAGPDAQDRARHAGLRPRSKCGAASRTDVGTIFGLYKDRYGSDLHIGMNGSSHYYMIAQCMQMTCRLLPYPVNELRAELWI